MRRETGRRAPAKEDAARDRIASAPRDGRSRKRLEINSQKIQFSLQWYKASEQHCSFCRRMLKRSTRFITTYILHHELNHLLYIPGDFDMPKCFCAMSKPDMDPTDEARIGYISVIKIHSGTNLPAGRFGGRTAHAPAILEDGGAQERRRTSPGGQPQMFYFFEGNRRPIVASTDSILSPLSILLEKVLTPLVKDTQAFLLDMGAFLKIIKDTGTLPEGTLLVTLDVNNLYTSIQHVKGIRATERILRDSHKDPNVISFLLSLLELVLTENFFLFEDTFYVQVQGSAMGSNVAPPYANCFMSVFESDHIYNNELFQTHCLLWRRYIDDVFCLWRGSQDTLLAFLEHINSVWPELSFTLNYSTTQINFLDTMVIQQPDGSIMVDLYVKETDRNNLLLYQSCHPTAVKKSIPCSQFERLRRIVSDPIVRSQRLNEMEGKFSLRGYPPRMLKQCRNTISSKKDSGSPPRIPLVHTFHPFLYKFHNKIRKHWHILRDSFPEVPEFQIPFMPCFRHPNNLRNKVVRADIGSRLTMPKQLFLRTQKKGTFPCLQCAQCANVLKGPKISHPQTGADIPIQVFFTCNSKQVIYAIKCPCGKVYVGETMQTIKERISHHKSDIRCGKNHLPIPYHFQEAGHSVTQLRFLVLEQRSDLEFNIRICGFPLSQPGYLLNGTYSVIPWSPPSDYWAHSNYSVARILYKSLKTSLLLSQVNELR
ncbi:unnamed protein product [Ranitomeya imitator]|uniref:Reverse transcriptase domain-containing protein n=1 Tax=Ranitomeya imitator TaxID=111125 RepID=A0ABN9LYK3_9NEOB|nr:unnamed protein product [Ranitomeya imitator]